MGRSSFTKEKIINGLGSFSRTAEEKKRSLRHIFKLFFYVCHGNEDGIGHMSRVEFSRRANIKVGKIRYFFHKEGHLIRIDPSGHGKSPTCTGEEGRKRKM